MGKVVKVYGVFRVCGSNSFDMFFFFIGGVFIFVAKVRKKCFPSRLLFEQRPTKFLPAVVLLGGRRGGAKRVKFEPEKESGAAGSCGGEAGGGRADDAGVVRLQNVEFPNYSRFPAAGSRWRPSAGGVGVITRQSRCETASVVGSAPAPSRLRRYL